MKQDKSLTSDEVKMGGANPLYTMLDDHRSQYLVDNSRKFEAFRQFSTPKTSGEQVKRAHRIIKMYTETYPGLDAVLFMLDEWARISNLFENQSLREYHLSLLFILFATRQFSSVDGNAAKFFNKVDEKSYKQSKTIGDFEPSLYIEEKGKSQMVRRIFVLFFL